MRHLPVGESVLVHVNVVITNPGTVVLRLRRATLRIQQVLPLYGEIRRAVAKGRDPVLPGEREAVWPELGARELSDLQIEIEPGENDEVAADFVVRQGVQTIEVYTYFENAQKCGRAMGWSQTTLYDLNPDLVVTAKLVRELEEADNDLASATAGEQQQAPEGLEGRFHADTTAAAQEDTCSRPRPEEEASTREDATAEGRSQEATNAY